MPDTRRVEREIRQCQVDDDAKVNVQTVNDNLLHLKGYLNGPEDTPYAGGQFVVDIQLPNDYPFQPPKMKFDTRVYHPNISSQTGAICLDILKDQWSPVLTLKTVLISLQSLLCDPVPNDPQDAEVARHYMSDRAGFDQTARQWTQIYATGGGNGEANGGKVPEPPKIPPEEIGLDPNAIARICEMGFDRKLVALALKNSNGNEERAIEE
ncbi:hypothetical protein HK097_001374, partial [Rhizophlyctis rosea]